MQPDYLLWAAQIVLAVKLVSATYTHGIRPDETKMQPGFERFGRATRPLLIVIAALTFLGAAGLILPAATGVLTWLTPWSAALLAVMVLLGAGFHLTCRDKPRPGVNLVLCALAAFVAYGRGVLAPL